MTVIVISYLIFLGLLSVLGVVAIFHAKRFGFVGDKTNLATGVYLLVTTSFIVLTFLILSSIDLEAGL